MDAWGILAIVLAIGVIALVGFMIPILIQVKDLLKLAENTVLRIEKDVEPLLQNVEGITHNFEGITGAANDFVHRKAKVKVVSEEVNLIENVKETVTGSVKAVKEEYIPEAKYTLGKYFTAAKTGYRVAVNTFKSSKIIDDDKQLIIYDNKNELVEIKETTEDLVLVQTTVMKK